MILKEVFATLNFPTEYFAIYNSLYLHGALRMSDLAKKTGIARTSCYEYLPKLIELDLVEEIVEGKGKLYRIKSPQNLIKLLYKYKNRLSFAINNIEYDFADIIENYEKTKSKYQSNYLFSFKEIKREFDSLKTNEQIYLLYDSRIKLQNDFDRLIKLLGDSVTHIHVDSNSKIINPTIKVVFDDKLIYIDVNLMCGVVISEKYIIDLERDFLNMHEV